jgi:hypothetical protein
MVQCLGNPFNIVIIDILIIRQAPRASLATKKEGWRAACIRVECRDSCFMFCRLKLATLWLGLDQSAGQSGCGPKPIAGHGHNGCVRGTPG